MWSEIRHREILDGLTHVCSLETSRNREEKSYRELVVGEIGKLLVREYKHPFMGQMCSGDLKHSRR